jgi:hypothetical protein
MRNDEQALGYADINLGKTGRTYRNGWLMRRVNAMCHASGESLTCAMNSRACKSEDIREGRIREGMMDIEYLLLEGVLGIRVERDLNGILDLRLHLLSLAGGAGQPAPQTLPSMTKSAQRKGARSMHPL